MNRKEREKAELRDKREQEILAAAEILFLEKGFSKTTVGDIANACELTKGALYLYFKNKNEIILIIMTKISRSFGDLLSQADDSGLTGMERVSRLLNVYKRTFRDFRNYHILDGQFNILFDRSYPESKYLTEYFQANSRVLDIMTEPFEKGNLDGTIRCGSAADARGKARMFLNVLNSYVEKLSLRKELMEREQGIELDSELDSFIDFLTESLHP